MLSAEIDKRPTPRATATYMTDNESERLGVYNNNLRPTKQMKSENHLDPMNVEVKFEDILPAKPHVTRRQHNKEANLEKVKEEADY
jgi:hypothetical protein